MCPSIKVELKEVRLKIVITNWFSILSRLNSSQALRTYLLYATLSLPVWVIKVQFKMELLFAVLFCIENITINDSVERINFGA